HFVSSFTENRGQLPLHFAGSRFSRFDLALVHVTKRQWERRGDSKLVFISVGPLIVSKRADAHSRPAFIQRKAHSVTLLFQLEHARSNIVISIACSEEKRGQRRERTQREIDVRQRKR